MLLKLGVKKGVPHIYVYGYSMVNIKWLRGGNKMLNLFLSPIYEVIILYKVVLTPSLFLNCSKKTIKRKLLFQKLVLWCMMIIDSARSREGQLQEPIRKFHSSSYFRIHLLVFCCLCGLSRSELKLTIIFWRLYMSHQFGLYLLDFMSLVHELCVT